MIRMTDLGGGKLLLATIVATGMAASSIGFNSAAAQTAGAAGTEGPPDGEANEFVDGGAGSVSDVHDDIYILLGTTPDEVQREVETTGSYTQNGPIAEYQHQVESGNLDGAANALAAASNVPITEQLVNDVNLELGVETRLTNQQIAEAAAARQNKDLQATDSQVLDSQVAVVIPVETADNVYEILGTTREEAERDMIPARPHTQNGPLEEYQHAVESGNLDRAAKALSAVSNVPITEDLVNEVNLELGVESRLTAQQVANAAGE